MYYYAPLSEPWKHYGYSEMAECVGKAVEYAIIERRALLDKTTTVAVDVFETRGPTLKGSAHCYRIEVSPTLAISVTNH